MPSANADVDEVEEDDEQEGDGEGTLVGIFSFDIDFDFKVDLGFQPGVELPMREYGFGVQLLRDGACNSGWN